MNGELSIYPEWRQAVADFLAMSPAPGFVLKREWLMHAFDIPEPITAEDQRRAELRFLECWDKFKNSLLEDHMVAFKTVNGVGFEVLAPRDQTRHAIQTRTKNVHRELRHMARQIAFVRLHELSDAERRENADAQVKVANLRALMTSTRLLSKS